MVMRNKVKELRWVPASELQKNPKNWRRHPDSQRAALHGTVDQIGFTTPLQVRELPDGSLELIDGHLRLEEFGDETLPVVVVDLTEAEAAVALATHDPLAMMAVNDTDSLLALLQETEFDSKVVSELLEAVANGERFPMPDLTQPTGSDAEDPGADIDKAEELREKWGVESGQVWEVGRHRLICGDASSESDHNTVIGTAAVDLVLTDPPYGVGIEYGVGIGVGTTFDDSPEAIHALIPLFMPLCLRWPVVLLTPGQNNLWEYPRPRWILSWNIPAGGGLNTWGFTTWHCVLAYGKDPYLARGLGGRPDGVTMMATRDKSVEGHPVIKPLDVWKWFLERGSPARGERVLDPFLGSGTTMVAAEQLGRICYGMEIEPKYVAVTLERMAGMGLEPKLVE